MVSNNEIVSIVLSAATVVLFIIAVIVFIDYGGSALFYVIVILAFASGLLNAWIISRRELPRSQTAAKPVMKAMPPRKTRKGKRSKARR